MYSFLPRLATISVKSLGKLFQGHKKASFEASGNKLKAMNGPGNYFFSKTFSGKFISMACGKIYSLPALSHIRV
jgi:hypothetical protein